MAQITSGIRAILSIPVVYSLFQEIVYPKGELIHKYVKPQKGQKILDIGCGTGEIVKHLPQVDYLGIDLSEDYIKSARKKQHPNARFQRIDMNNFTPPDASAFDTVLSISMLHHIDDQEVIKLFQIAKNALKLGGRLVIAEPCYAEGQSFLSKWVLSKDRGQNIRNTQGYLGLAQQVFSQVTYHIRHDLLRIPCTVIILECTA